MRGKNVIGGMVGTFIPYLDCVLQRRCSRWLWLSPPPIETPKGESRGIHKVATGKIVFARSGCSCSGNLPNQSRSLLASYQNLANSRIFVNCGYARVMKEPY